MEVLACQFRVFTKTRYEDGDVHDNGASQALQRSSTHPLLVWCVTECTGALEPVASSIVRSIVRSFR